MKFNIHDYSGGVCMHCPTEDSAETFMSYLITETDRTWNNGEPYSLDDLKWEKYKQNLCYYFNDGQYGSTGYARSNRYKVLEFGDFDWSVKEKFDVAYYPGDVVMHCDEYEKAVVFTRYLHEIGREWIDGKSYQNLTNWESYEGDTCYDFNHGTYSDRSWFEEDGYTILEFDDFDWNEEIIAVRAVTEEDINAFLFG